MEMFRKELLLGGSRTVLVVAASFFATPGLAQEAASPAAPVEEVTVTGTSIRGIAPVGSNVITVDQQQIRTAGATDMEELLNTIPALSTANAPPQGVNNNSFFAPQIHQLAGSISNSTLSVVDGMRFVGAGGDSLSDPNIIPTAAIERVEVLADGASAIYGSDAVSGVVNFITRKDYEGLEIGLEEGTADQYNDTNASLLWGTKWDKGSVMFAAGYLFQSQLLGSARQLTSMGNYTSIGGTNYTSVFGCPAAAIIVPGNAGVFLSAASTTTVANTQANKNCNIQPYGDSLPESVRENALMRFNQTFSDRLSASVMMDYNELVVTTRSQPGQITANTTAYGPTSGMGGQINPFYQAPAGSPGSTASEQVSWVDLMGNGNGTNYGQNVVNEEAWYGQAALDYKISDNWQAQLTDAVGVDNYDGASINTFCGSCATLAINGTAQTNGSTTTSDVAGANVVALNTPLTTANALDIWNPTSSNNTSALVRQQLYSNRTGSDAENTFNQLRLQVDGPALSLPAGDVKVAFGGEYANYHLYNFSTGSNGTGFEANGATIAIFRAHRNVLSGFGEINAPLVSPEMGWPLVQKVSVDVSARYDKYSDVGPTFNPKYGVDWLVVDGVKLRGNYSTSFVAVPVGISGDPSQGGEYGGGASLAPLSPVPVSAFPQVTQIPGCAGLTAGQSCNLGTSTNPGLIRQYGSALANARPQRGNGINLGTDFTPTFIPGLTLDVSWFHQHYKGGITAPNHTQIVNTASANYLLTLCPTGCTQAQINAFTRVPEGGTVAGQLPPTIYFLENHDENNVLDLWIEGIDLSANYYFDTDWGQFHFGDATTQFTRFNEALLGGIPFSVLGTSAFNSTFPSIAMQSRANLGWSDELVNIDFFMNWTSAYRNIGATAANPPTPDANGALVVGGDHVDANVTFDGHASYNFQAGWFNGDQVYIDMKNIFNKAPPFYNYAVPSNVNSSNGINTFVSNPIGRLFSVGFRAQF
jgi:iron complex outermembrane recepter protein